MRLQHTHVSLFVFRLSVYGITIGHVLITFHQLRYENRERNLIQILMHLEFSASSNVTEAIVATRLYLVYIFPHKFCLMAFTFSMKRNVKILIKMT